MKLKDYIEDISHQLKTPITSMRMDEELLLNVVDNQKQKEKLEHIHQQTLKMNDLVNDLLTLALLDSHSIVFHYQECSIVQLINDVEENLDFLLRKYHMSLKLHQEQIMMICDIKWLEEALENIIKNCIEKNHHQVIDIFAEEFDSMIKIKIQDYGDGFHDEDLEHIFERFYRGKENHYQGIGIGLSLANEIIKAHHGFISVYNQQGAVFEINLPKISAKKKV